MWCLNILIVYSLSHVHAMTEQKELQQKNKEIYTPKGSWEPDFTGIENLKLNDLVVADTSKNSIAQVNIATSQETSPEEINLADMSKNIQNTQQHDPVNLLQQSEHIPVTRSRYHNQYRRLFLISFFIILVTSIASLILQVYTRYVYIAAQAVPDQQYSIYIDTYKKWRQRIADILHLPQYKAYQNISLMGTWAEETMQQIINDPTINYLQKKEILQQAFTSFATKFVQDQQQLTTVKEEISKYGFFSQEMYDLLNTQNYTTSIKQYLLSLEIIKFSSAVKVFSYLDTFVTNLSSALHESSSVVEDNMHTFAARGEKDILLYLNNCYLNPYEIDYECNLIGDFDRYYTKIHPETPTPDSKFFKKMMYYIDNKLEQIDIPSFSIVFKKYDPNQKEIWFTIEVNTFKQDELALIKKWIINPHIFILSNVLNLIKQSSFVVSENIDAKSVKITPRTIQIWTSIYTVNTSTMDFVLPIQKSSQREISDYIDPNFTSSSAQ